MAITAVDVREYILDRNISDNALDLDLAFSDEEIVSAMKRAAREFNSIPPFVCTVKPDDLSDDTNLFLDGIAAQLYISRMSKLQRSDIDYTAGGVTTNLVSKQIEHLKSGIEFHNARFQEAAKAVKIGINLRQAYGQVG